MSKSYLAVACALLLATVCGCPGTRGFPTAETGYIVRPMANGVFMFEANPKAADKADIQAFLHELNNLMQANKNLEVRNVVPIRAGEYQRGGKNSEIREYYSIIIFTVPKGEPSPAEKEPAAK